MKTFYSLLFFTLILCSCSSNNLSRAKAEELIVKNQHLPAIQTVELSRNFLKKSWSDPSWMPAACVSVGGTYWDHKQRLDDLTAKGLITLGESHQHNGECNYMWATVTLTDEGKKYLVSDTGGAYQLRALEVSFGEVTGIQVNEQFKVAEAHYTLKKSNITPFGGNIASDPISGNATFALFDDGWRIQ